MTKTGNDARRRGRGPLHVGGRITGRTYHRCECGAEWTTAYKAQKCVRTHAGGEAVQSAARCENDEPTP